MAKRSFEQHGERVNENGGLGKRLIALLRSVSTRHRTTPKGSPWHGRSSVRRSRTDIVAFQQTGDPVLGDRFVQPPPFVPRTVFERVQLLDQTGARDLALESGFEIFEDRAAVLQQKTSRLVVTRISIRQGDCRCTRRLRPCLTGQVGDGEQRSPAGIQFTVVQVGTCRWQMSGLQYCRAKRVA